MEKSVKCYFGQVIKFCITNNKPWLHVLLIQCEENDTSQSEALFTQSIFFTGVEFIEYTLAI